MSTHPASLGCPPPSLTQTLGPIVKYTCSLSLPIMFFYPRTVQRFWSTAPTPDTSTIERSKALLTRGPSSHYLAKLQSTSLGSGVPRTDGSGVICCPGSGGNLNKGYSKASHLNQLMESFGAANTGRSARMKMLFISGKIGKKGSSRLTTLHFSLLKEVN